MEKVLNPEQELFLNLITQEKSLTKLFYLSGGTALTVFYLFHRKSEDLDFFSETEFDPLITYTFLRKIKTKLKIKKIDLQQTFNRNIYFLYLGALKKPLKVEFTYYPFKQIEKGKNVGSLNIDSVLDIAVNKAFTISQNPRTRDFIDIYFILKKYPKVDFKDLLKKARVKFDWHIDYINLGTQLLKVKILKDYPIMLKDFDYGEVEDFFLQEAGKLKEQIFKP
jgi:hypothetical protein